MAGGQGVDTLRHLFWEGSDMCRILICVTILTAGLSSAGCQHPAWQNPYAMIGPATVPPPTVQNEGAGYYPAGESQSARGLPASAAIRSEIPAARSASSAPAPSFPSATAGSEPPIRIVEAAPAKVRPTTTPVKASPAPVREPTSPPGPPRPLPRDSAVAPASFHADTPVFLKTTSAAQGRWQAR